MRITHRPFTRAMLRRPLLGSGWALSQLPVEVEQVLEEVVAPLGRRRGPCDFKAAADRIGTVAFAEFVLPAKTLVLNIGALRFVAYILSRNARAVSFAEGVADGDQSDRFFVVHRHTPKCFANIPAGRNRISLSVRSFGLHIDQSHLDRAEWLGETAMTAVALVGQPCAFGSPVDLFFRLPNIRAATGEAECLEAHGFERDVAGENHQIGPGNFPAVLLLDRPQQAACLIEVHVVGPAVERREALLTGSGAAAAIADAIGTGAVPRHADEETAVVSEVGRPPVLRVSHQ